MLHVIMRYGFLIVLLVAQACAWRFGNQWFGLTASSALLLYAIVHSQSLPHCWRQQQFLCYLTACILCFIGLNEQLWPCELSCSKGQSYASIFDIKLLWFAAISYGIAAAVMLKRSKTHNWFHHSMTWLLCGGSLFYIGLSMYLAMLCPLCLAIHSCIFAASISALPCRRSLVMVLAHVLVGAGLIALVYGIQYQMRPRIIIPQQVQQDPNNEQTINQFMNNFSMPKTQDKALIERIEQQRRLGSPDAQYTLACFINLGCNHCASMVPMIHEESKTLCKEYSLNIYFPYLINRMSQKDLNRHYLPLSAAYDDAFILAQTALLGHEADARGYEESLAAFGLDSEALKKRIAENRASFDQIYVNDQKLMQRSSIPAHKSPIIFLLKGNDILKQWDGNSTWAEISAAAKELMQ